MNSLRMSAWMVPDSFSLGMPRFSATTTYMANKIQAVGLMVIDTLMAPTSMPSNISSRSASVSTATPSRPTSPAERGSSES